jgi:hypothetical protein
MIPEWLAKLDNGPACDGNPKVNYKLADRALARQHQTTLLAFFICAKRHSSLSLIRSETRHAAAGVPHALYLLLELKGS